MFTIFVCYLWITGVVLTVYDTVDKLIFPSVEICETDYLISNGKSSLIVALQVFAIFIVTLTTWWILVPLSFCDRLVLYRKTKWLM